jgi:hypothetical protein
VKYQLPGQKGALAVTQRYNDLQSAPLGTQTHLMRDASHADVSSAPVTLLLDLNPVTTLLVLSNLSMHGTRSIATLGQGISPPDAHRIVQAVVQERLVHTIIKLRKTPVDAQCDRHHEIRLV